MQRHQQDGADQAKTGQSHDGRVYRASNQSLTGSCRLEKTAGRTSGRTLRPVQTHALHLATTRRSRVRTCCLSPAYPGMHHLPTHSPLNIPLQGITRMLGGGLGRQDRPALNERPIGPCPIPTRGIYGESVAGDQVQLTGGGPDDERLRHERLGLAADDPGHARLLGPGRVLALALLRHPGPPNQQPQPGQQPRPGAEEILAERLARGELDPEEYRQRLQTLQETTSRPTPPLR